MKLNAYEVEGHGNYWEIYFPSGTYYATVETEDFGDFISTMLDRGCEDITVMSQEPYQVMTALHIELDKFFGQPGDYLDDCEVIQNPKLALHPMCPGCKAFADWTKGKTYGDFYNNPLLWNKNVFLHNDVELVANV